jgi:hypothetical protein
MMDYRLTTVQKQKLSALTLSTVHVTDPDFVITKQINRGRWEDRLDQEGKEADCTASKLKME